jgi:hypothetical protein
LIIVFALAFVGIVLSVPAILTGNTVLPLLVIAFGAVGLLALAIGDPSASGLALITRWAKNLNDWFRSRRQHHPPPNPDGASESQKAESESRRTIGRLVTFALFGVLASFTPFGFEYFQLSDQGHPTNFSAILGPKDLALITATLAAGAFGELFLNFIRPLVKNFNLRDVILLRKHFAYYGASVLSLFPIIGVLYIGNDSAKILERPADLSLPLQGWSSFGGAVLAGVVAIIAFASGDAS